MTASGTRSRSQIYLLFNSQDISGNVRGMSEAMKNLCLSSDTCIRQMLKAIFVGDYGSGSRTLDKHCCSVCDVED